MIFMIEFLKRKRDYLLGIQRNKPVFLTSEGGIQPGQSVDEAVDKMLEEMRSYRGLEISNAQRESIKTILKAYVKEKQDK